MPIRSPLSPVLIIQDLEEKIFSNININIPISYWYVDDILLTIPNNQINEILDRFNSYHDRLRFTMKHGNDKSINFFDVKLILEDSYTKFDTKNPLTQEDI